MNVDFIFVLFSCCVRGPGHLNKRFVYYPGLGPGTIGQRQRTHCNSVQPSDRIVLLYSWIATDNLI